MSYARLSLRTFLYLLTHWFQGTDMLISVFGLKKAEKVRTKSIKINGRIATRQLVKSLRIR